VLSSPRSNARELRLSTCGVAVRQQKRDSLSWGVSLWKTNCGSVDIGFSDCAFNGGLRETDVGFIVPPEPNGSACGHLRLL
jgi:hypothetical protein